MAWYRSLSAPDSPLLLVSAAVRSISARRSGGRSFHSQRARSSLFGKGCLRAAGRIYGASQRLGRDTLQACHFEMRPVVPSVAPNLPAIRGHRSRPQNPALASGRPSNSKLRLDERSAESPPKNRCPNHGVCRRTTSPLSRASQKCPDTFMRRATSEHCKKRFPATSSPRQRFW